MLNAKQREVAESVFDRNKRREAEINDAFETGAGAPRGGGQEYAPLEHIAPIARCKIKERVAQLPALSATIISNVTDLTPISSDDGAAGNWCSRIDAGCHRR